MCYSNHGDSKLLFTSEHRAETLFVYIYFYSMLFMDEWMFKISGFCHLKLTLELNEKEECCLLCLLLTWET